jgi:hypothetical protein
MTRKTKSQLRKTKKNMKGSGNKNKKGSKKTKAHELPFIQNPFSNKYGKRRFNPLFEMNNNNNRRLPSGVSRNNIFNQELYGNTNSSRFLYENSNEFSKSNSGSSSGYVFLGSTNGVNQNPYTPMNPIYTNVGKPGEKKLKLNLNNVHNISFHV